MSAQPTFSSYDEWYAKGHLAPYVTSRSTPGSNGVLMLEVSQPAGDVSDPAVPEFTLQVPLRPARVATNFGAGKFSSRALPGMLFLTNPGSPSYIVADDPSHVRLIAFPAHVVTSALSPLGHDKLDFGVLHARPASDLSINRLIDVLWAAGDGSAPAHHLFADSVAVAIISRLYELAGGPSQLSQRGGITPHLLRRTTDYLMAHLAEDLGLAELATIADLSPHHFCRAFKQSTGLPPHAWLTARRIERAQELMLAHRDMGLTEIGLSVGYASQAAFGVAFKRVTGLTPGQWRRERVG